MPCYKLTLPNPDGVGDEQPLFQVSKTNRLAPFWTMTYYTYAVRPGPIAARSSESDDAQGHLIPPKRVEFGRIEKTTTDKGGDGGTRVIITGKTDEQKAVWKTLGEGKCVSSSALR